MHKTIDANEHNASSVNDTVSAGGTRYMVQIKGGVPKFYGQTSDHQSRIDYDNMSQTHSYGGASQARNNPQRAMEILSQSSKPGDQSPHKQVLYDDEQYDSLSQRNVVSKQRQKTMDGAYSDVRNQIQTPGPG